MEVNEKIEEVFKTLGKNTDKKKHHNCGACGFHNCVNFANAVVEGRTVLNACFFYSQVRLYNKFIEIEGLYFLICNVALLIAISEGSMSIILLTMAVPYFSMKIILAIPCPQPQSMILIFEEK
jgi:hypothetical protein